MIEHLKEMIVAQRPTIGDADLRQCTDDAIRALLMPAVSASLDAFLAREQQAQLVAMRAAADAREAQLEKSWQESEVGSAYEEQVRCAALARDTDATLDLLTGLPASFPGRTLPYGVEAAIKRDAWHMDEEQFVARHADHFKAIGVDAADYWFGKAVHGEVRKHWRAAGLNLPEWQVPAPAHEGIALPARVRSDFEQLAAMIRLDTSKLKVVTGGLREIDGLDESSYSKRVG